MLGAAVKNALETFGVTARLVERWLGDSCCAERRRKLHQLGEWAAKALKVRTELAKDYLKALLEK